MDDSGIQFGGPITSAKVAWAYFGKFFEDERAFVLNQKNQVIFHIVPKRALSADQVAGFRQYLAWIIHDFASKKRKGALKD